MKEIFENVLIGSTNTPKTRFKKWKLIPEEQSIYFKFSETRVKF